MIFRQVKSSTAGKHFPLHVRDYNMKAKRAVNLPFFVIIWYNGRVFTYGFRAAQHALEN